MNQPSVFKPVLYYQIDYVELEQYLCTVYGFTEYDFVASMEVVNDSEHTYSIYKVHNEYMDKNIKDTVEQVKQHATGYIGHLLTDLCNKDIILEGDYLIRVNW